MTPGQLAIKRKIGHNRMYRKTAMVPALQEKTQTWPLHFARSRRDFS
jgi:hypothetical protein